MGSVPTADSDGNDALRRRIKALERAVAYMRSARATIGKAGVDGSSGLKVYDGAGHVLAIIGKQPDGTIGFKTYRPNGAVLLDSVGSGYLGLNYTAIRDRDGHAIVYDDPVTAGVARPRISMGQWVDFTALGVPAAPTTSATFVTLQALFAYEQSARIRVDVMVSSNDASTTGEVRVVDPFATQVGPVLTVAANTTALMQLGPVGLPSWPSYDTAGYFSLQARRTAGTGTIGARGMGAWGVASFDSV
jgi:hypothetical protein